MHQSIFTSVNQQLGYPVQWKALDTEGTSNNLYQGSNHIHVLVLRINAPQSLAFGVDRTREAQVLNMIQPYPWALKIIANNPEEGWCVMRHQGVNLSGSLLSTLEKNQLLQAVSDYQQIKYGYRDEQINYKQLFESYRVQLSQVTESDYWLEQLCLLEQYFSELPIVACCLTHHDLHTGNLCIQDEQIRLIDWEYAGIGNPWFDAYALHQYCQITPKEIHLLPAFKHFPELVFSQGLLVAGKVCALLEQLWYKVRA
ncbi:thiamine kinase [Oceanospirillum multiglobuliferum]|uniref:Aminoglycoside phosphotransferase domain-containing protein n=1 Tax=Oceanospirillum multiglobuliferum TaxID=64969 RepID=A0A1T4R4R6_9GAMM|nr:phosphotransferase [Oceanospirillum multiglobuliferum]OPX55232.1 hypothetical protein BTE48_09865 [Oceanospirillum multiglobuliferum]SKA11050.1 thiamine kinase [Oceanospirillum multiglobuliferum]